MVEEITLNAEDEWEYTERTAEIVVNLTDSKAVHSMRLVKDVVADEN